jgi:hypothetical protein
MNLTSCDDAAFRPYGRVLPGLPTKGLMDWMQTNVNVAEGTQYQRSIGALEDLAGPEQKTWKQWASRVFYGSFPAQVGWVAGHSRKLNALEYHKASEITVAVTDLVLFLGHVQDIQHHSSYDSSLIQGFRLPAGTAVEIYATTLHFAPVTTSAAGFQAVIILPLGTNAPLEAVNTQANGEEGLLWMANKWLIACQESIPAKRGAKVGISSNLELPG